MPTWLEAINFVGDSVLAVTREVGNTIGDAVLETIGVDTTALAESSKPKFEPRQERQVVQNIEIVLECPLEIIECERCGECGKEIEDWEDVEDFEE